MEKEKTNKMADLSNKLKELSMDLHEAEVGIFKKDVGEDGRFGTIGKETLFKEIGKTRKQVEQLLYIFERYGV